ncbi:MAG: ZIP family metal transporter [Chloroflexota bacterium]|jgi:ZIP family zinc transporter|nr:ZIP family metal transporter [Anaerolineae bacterium]HMM29797.1 ZIP family metal transporter [Aggregatilineaceae bacterium]
MLSFFQDLHPIVQALLATGFTWGLTALGAASVFVTRTFDRRLLDSMLGFAAGVMTAASFWSLLAPAIDMAEDVSSLPAFVPAVTGFLMGGVFLRGLDFVLPHLHVSTPEGTPEGLHTTWRRSVLLVLAITLHNIPEGLAIGVAFGAAAENLSSTTVASAVALAIGVGIQNFPEGLAVAMPLRGEGMSRRKSWWYGQLSAVVEPVAAVIGAAAVLIAQPILPYALAFAAGAMIFVVVEEVIPDSQCNGNADRATMGSMLGFAVMMTLDVALG